MKVSLYKEKELKEEKVHIYYREMNPKIENIIEYISKEDITMEGFLNEEKHLVNINEIYYFDSVDKKTFAYLENKVLEVKYKLSYIEELLGEFGFVRVSKSIIVNIFKIKYIKSEINMRISACLENDEIIIINRHYKKNFQNKLNEIKDRLEG